MNVAMKVVIEKNRETYPHIPDEPSKSLYFSPLKLLSFTVIAPPVTHFLSIMWEY